MRALEAGGVSYVPQQVTPSPVVTKPAPIQPATPEPIEKSSMQSTVVQSEQKPVVKQEEFTPPPVSKKPTGNDIASLWQMLLMNIKSPSTTALLKLATPLQISPEGIRQPGPEYLRPR